MFPAFQCRYYFNDVWFLNLFQAPAFTKEEEKTIRQWLEMCCTLMQMLLPTSEPMILFVFGKIVAAQPNTNSDHMFLTASTAFGLLVFD